MNHSNPLYLTAVANITGPGVRHACEVLNDVPSAALNQLHGAGWRLAVEDPDVGPEFSPDQFAWAIVDGPEQAKRCISRITQILDTFAGQVHLLQGTFQVWEVDERMDRPCKDLTSIWSRATAELVHANHPNVVRFRPRWLLRETFACIEGN